MDFRSTDAEKDLESDEEDKPCGID